MKYSEFGLDETKKAIDEGVLGMFYCPWCQDQNVTNGFSLCFSNFCVCKQCVATASENKERWKQDDGNGCFKCDSKTTKVKKHDTLFFDQAGVLSICKNCLEWATEILKINSSSNNNTMVKLKTASTPTESKVENISLGSIVASKNNPRKIFDKAYIQELADSMKGPAGLLSPITLRPKDGKYEIVVGECRYRAAKLLKWEAIPAMIKNISDEDLLEVMIIENLNREGISPMEEAKAFQTLLQKESIDWLASKIHKPKKYISDRLKLNDLVSEAVGYLSAGVLPLGHAVFISKLSFSDQKACLAACIKTHYSYTSDEDDPQICDMPLEKLKDFIADTIMLDFEKAPFNIDDNTLYPEAGACSSCPKRTCNSNLLFQDITNEDKCTDASCFQEKIKLHVEREKGAAKEKYGKVLSGERPTYNSHTHVKVQGVDVPFKTTPTKNSIPVVITKVDRYGGKEHMGKTVYIDKNKIELVKKEKEEGSKVRNNSHSYEDISKKEFIEIIWPRLQTIAKIQSAPETIIREFFRKTFDGYHNGERILALAGVLGANGFAKTAEQAWEQRQGYGFEFEKEMIDRIIDTYPIEKLIVIKMMLDSVDDDDDIEIEPEEFGMTWNMIVEILNPSATAPKKSNSKK